MGHLQHVPLQAVFTVKEQVCGKRRQARLGETEGQVGGAYLQLRQLAFCRAPLLRGKVTGLDGLSQIQLATFMRLVQSFQLALQIQNLHG